MASRRERLDPFHVGVAAEAYAAALFAHTGCDVSVQYGANQPEYDLLIARDDRFLKISVKGSQDGGWGLCQNFKKGRTYHQAVDQWRAKQSRHVTYCFIQLQGVALGEMPRAYLATVVEVAAQMKHARNGHGQTILYENYAYKKGLGVGCTDCLPEHWRFSKRRVADLLAAAA